MLWVFQHQWWRLLVRFLSSNVQAQCRSVVQLLIEILLPTFRQVPNTTVGLLVVKNTNIFLQSQRRVSVYLDKMILGREMNNLVGQMDVISSRIPFLQLGGLCLDKTNADVYLTT